MSEEPDPDAPRLTREETERYQRRLDEIFRREFSKPEYQRTHLGRIARHPK
jgi:hypothetical protein